ncbi:MAG: hypothetical protein ACSHYF_09235 [Verrucomicrobiaceae bacterium]
MFKRILHEDWTMVVPVIAFGITFVFFLLVIIRAIRMNKETRQHLSTLPLQDDAPDQP